MRLSLINLISDLYSKDMLVLDLSCLSLDDSNRRLIKTANKWIFHQESLDFDT